MSDIPTNEDILDQLKTTLYAIISGEDASISYDGVSYTKHNVKDLVSLIKVYENRVAQDNAEDDDNDYTASRAVFL